MRRNSRIGILRGTRCLYASMMCHRRKVQLQDGGGFQDMSVVVGFREYAKLAWKFYRDEESL